MLCRRPGLATRVICSITCHFTSLSSTDDTRWLQAELISHEPLRDDSYASESDLSALQAVEAEAIMCEAESAQIDTSRGQRLIHQADGSGVSEPVQGCGVLQRPCTGSIAHPFLK